MSPLEMIREWRNGCSNADKHHPQDCGVCTLALIDALERTLDTEPRAGDGDALRQAFEAAFTSGDQRIDTHNFHRGGILRVPDAYTHDRIQALWEGWQKHAAQRNEGDGE